MNEIDNGLIPEWYRQEAVILAWPSEHMDWAYILDEVRACYTEIVEALLRYTNVVLLVGELTDLPKERIDAWQGGSPHRVIVKSSFRLNDTWMRDVMPLFGRRKGKLVAYDYGFNGWGLKFASNLDNTAVRRLFFEESFFRPEVMYVNKLDTILEGGAIDVNSRGDLLTTGSVLWEKNRNPNFLIGRSMSYFSYDMGVNRVFELERVTPMLGDDTDGHIDTLARFVADDTIVYNATIDREEYHYQMLRELEEELREMMTMEGKPYKLVPLPIPQPMYDEEGYRLPATYANFLITNGAVLVPTYNDPSDEEALRILRETMPKYEVVGIDCTALVRQHGSLHCITMQVPEGYINPNELK